jgi:hypothetical protein
MEEIAIIIIFIVASFIVYRLFKDSDFTLFSGFKKKEVDQRDCFDEDELED